MKERPVPQCGQKRSKNKELEEAPKLGNFARPKNKEI